MIMLNINRKTKKKNTTTTATAINNNRRKQEKLSDKNEINQQKQIQC